MQSNKKNHKKNASQVKACSSGVVEVYVKNKKNQNCRTNARQLYIKGILIYTL